MVLLVPRAGLEPARHEPRNFKSILTPFIIKQIEGNTLLKQALRNTAEHPRTLRNTVELQQNCSTKTPH